jgi:hypothetical protein
MLSCQHEKVKCHHALQQKWILKKMHEEKLVHKWSHQRETEEDDKKLASMIIDSNKSQFL